MRTAVVSDLHLATRTRRDLARDPTVRARLLGQLSDVDEVVLLGDVIELRDAPLPAALALAEPVLAELGRASRVLLVPGNHDHQLAREAAALRNRAGTPEVLATVSSRAGGALGRIRAALGTELVVAYPGVWLADGVWATHGHYLDAHSAAPTVECMAAALVGLARRRRLPAAATPCDYEAVLSPTYRLYFEIAQRRRLERLADAGKALVRATERVLGVRDGAGRRPRSPALGGGRLGTVRGEVRRPGILPLEAVLDRLGVEAEHVLFGHTHRTGPLPTDPAAMWRTSGGTQLWNTGSWVYEPRLCQPGGPDGAYWPGTVVLVEDGVPRAVRALASWAP
jgi:3',5'-cyclic AMP phosphodiesterase CpdA